MDVSYEEFSGSQMIILSVIFLLTFIILYMSSGLAIISDYSGWLGFILCLILSVTPSVFCKKKVQLNAIVFT